MSSNNLLLFMCVCVPCECSAHRDQKRASGPLELEVLVVELSDVGARLNSGPLEEPRVLNHSATFSSPSSSI